MDTEKLNKLFIKNSKEKFNYLITDFKCDLVDIINESHGVYLIYKNLTSFIKVCFVIRDGGIFILLGKLEDGKIPQYPSTINKSTELKTFDFDDFIDVLASSETIDQSCEDIFNDKYLINIISSYADKLKKYATDVLTGDFKIFSELDKIVKRRIVKGDVVKILK